MVEPNRLLQPPGNYNPTAAKLRLHSDFLGGGQRYSTILHLFAEKPSRLMSPLSKDEIGHESSM